MWSHISAITSSPHQRLLVVAGLRRGVVFVGDRLPILGDQEKFRLHAGLHSESLGGGVADDPF
jgi:hypothetical protein